MKMARLSLLAVLAPAATAYNADANNVHLQFASSPSSGSVSPEAEAVAARPEDEHLQLLEEHLVTVDLPNFGTAETVLGLFEEWVGRHSRSYESAEERARRMLVWVDNHGAFSLNSAEKPPLGFAHTSFFETINPPLNRILEPMMAFIEPFWILLIMSNSHDASPSTT